MSYLVIKSLHIIFVVMWFASLFYIVRLLIYHTEAQTKPTPEKHILSTQFTTMERRLWNGIAWPSMILTTVFGSLLLIKNPIFLKMPWMHLKLSFLFVLYLYHFKCHILVKKFSKGQIHTTSKKLRLFNELPTLILVAIIFLVVTKNHIDWVYAILGTLALFGIIFYIRYQLKLKDKVRVKHLIKETAYEKLDK